MSEHEFTHDRKALIKERYTSPAKQLRLSSQFREAIDLLTQGLYRYADSSRILCSLGEVYKCMGDTRNAMKNFRSALRAQPRNHVALNSIAHTYHLLGEHDKARRCYMEVLRNRPSDRVALTGVGQAYRAGGYYARARECFITVLANNPADKTARHLLDRLETEV